MSYTLTVQPEAKADLAEAGRWYESQAEGLGFEFLRAVDASLSAISQNPLRHAIVFENIRRVFVRKFPYSIF